MLSLARLIFGSSESTASPRDRLIDAAIEKAVDVSDPRLRALSGYQKQLRDATKIAVDFVMDVVDTLPPIVEVTPKAFGSDPQVRAFFGSSNQIAEVFSDTPEVQELAARPRDEKETHFYAALRMELTEKRVLGSQLRGDKVQHDVLRTILNFGDHAVLSPSISEPELRKAVKERVFVGLIEQALLRMASAESRSHDLKEQRALLKTKLNTLRARGFGLTPSVSALETATETIEEVEQRLKTLEDKLEAIPRTGGTLEENLEALEDVLSHPGRHVEITQETERLTRMGFKCTGETVDQGDDITYTQVKLEDNTLAAVLVAYPYDQLRPPRKLMTNPIHF